MQHRPELCNLMLKLRIRIREQQSSGPGLRFLKKSRTKMFLTNIFQMKGVMELTQLTQAVVLPLLHLLVHQHLQQALCIVVVHQLLQLLHPKLDVLYTVHTNCLHAAVSYIVKPIPALRQTTFVHHNQPTPPRAVPRLLMTPPPI